MPLVDPAAKRRYNRAFRAKQKAANTAWVNAEKERIQCSLCPPRAWWPAEALDFDHRPDEDKTANVSQLVSGGKPINKVKAEVAKCDVVCANHHRIITKERLDMEVLAPVA